MFECCFCQKPVDDFCEGTSDNSHLHCLPFISIVTRLDRSSTEKCRHSLCWSEIISNSRRNNARTFVHSDRFRKLRCRFALYTAKVIKSIALPFFIALHFFCTLFSLLFSFLSILTVKKSLRPFSESKFYLFTIIVHNFVLCFYYSIVWVTRTRKKERRRR